MTASIALAPPSPLDLETWGVPIALVYKLTGVGSDRLHHYQRRHGLLPATRVGTGRTHPWTLIEVVAVDFVTRWHGVMQGAALAALANKIAATEGGAAALYSVMILPPGGVFEGQYRAGEFKIESLAIAWRFSQHMAVMEGQDAADLAYEDWRGRRGDCWRAMISAAAAPFDKARKDGLEVGAAFGVAAHHLLS